jgi:ribosomal protein L27
MVTDGMPHRNARNLHVRKARGKAVKTRANAAIVRQRGAQMRMGITT